MRFCKWMRVALLLGCIVLSQLSCGPASKTPNFAPGTRVGVKGRLVDANSEPVAGMQVDFQNRRSSGFVQVTSVTPVLFLFPALIFAWPFLVLDRYSVTTKNKPNFRFAQVLSGSSGEFEFSFQAEELLRDEAGAVNISIYTQSSEKTGLVKADFIILEAQTNLGDIYASNIGTIQNSTENGNVRFEWEEPKYPVEFFIFKIVETQTQALIWASEIDGKVPSIQVPVSVFSQKSVSIGIESMQKNGDDLKTLSLSPITSFETGGLQQKRIDPVKVTSPDINFKLASLTNRKFDDKPFFAAFSAKSIVLELAQEEEITGITLHNLTLVKQGKVRIAISSDNTNWKNIGESDASRYFHLNFETAHLGKYVQISFDDMITNLQEIVISGAAL